MRKRFVMIVPCTVEGWSVQCLWARRAGLLGKASIVLECDVQVVSSEEREIALDAVGRTTQQGEHGELETREKGVVSPCSHKSQTLAASSEISWS